MDDTVCEKYGISKEKWAQFCQTRTDPSWEVCTLPFKLFLHCPSASYQWYKLFSVFGEHGLFVLWTFKSSYVLISKDLLVAKMPKALGCSQDVVLWCVWLERNGRIFSWQSSIEFIWDRVVSFASLCCYAFT